MKVTKVKEVNYGIGYPGYNVEYQIENDDGKIVKISGPNVNGPTWGGDTVSFPFNNPREAWRYCQENA
jgi:hypothetical protein